MPTMFRIYALILIVQGVFVYANTANLVSIGILKPTGAMKLPQLKLSNLFNSYVYPLFAKQKRVFKPKNRIELVSLYRTIYYVCICCNIGIRSVIERLDT